MTFRVRLKSVRFKDGRAPLTIMRSLDEDANRAVRNTVRQVVDAQGNDLAGVAIVVWGRDGGSTAAVNCGPRSPVLKAQAPDFVRNRLLLEIAEQWTIGSLRDSGQI